MVVDDDNRIRNIWIDNIDIAKRSFKFLAKRHQRARSTRFILKVLFDFQIAFKSRDHFNIPIDALCFRMATMKRSKTPKHGNHHNYACNKIIELFNTETSWSWQTSKYTLTRIMFFNYRGVIIIHQKNNSEWGLL